MQSSFQPDSIEMQGNDALITSGSGLWRLKTALRIRSIVVQLHQEARFATLPYISIDLELKAHVLPT